MNDKKPVENSNSISGRPSYSPLGHIVNNKMTGSLSLPWIPPPFSYLSAFLVVSAVVVFQYSLLPEPSTAPFIFFFPAIYLAAFLGGLWPGALAVILSASAGNFFFIAPYWSWSLSFESLAATLLFIASSFILVLLSLYFRRVLFNFNRAIGERQKAEADVRRANEEWDRTFDAISDLTFIQDKNFGIVRVNRAFAQALKLKPEEIVGRKCYEVLHKSGRPWANCPFEKTRLDMTAHTEEVFDPEIGRPLLVTTSPIFSPTGEFLGSVHIAKDITELKRAEENLWQEKARIESLLLSIGDGVVAIGMRGEILFANQAFADLINQGGNNLLGKNLNEIVTLLDEKGLKLSDDLRPAQIALETGKKVILSTIHPAYYMNSAKELTALSITATPIILNNKIMGVISVYRDITREKAVDQAKTEFVSLASHQLRTPLSGIALSTELLLRGAAGELSPEQKKYLSETYNSTKVMAELIKVLLDISRIELGTFIVQMEPVDLAESVDYLLDELKLQFDSKKLVLRKNYENIPVIKFDKNILRTTVENLITNAIRYTEAGGTIAVSLGKNDKEIIIKVADNGCGIPEKDQAKVFTKLFRAENAKLISAEGAGLGLYLVKSSLDKVGSRVWFESKPGQGTTFFVAIPLTGQ